MGTQIKFTKEQRSLLKRMQEIPINKLITTPEMYKLYYDERIN
jgi:hypothetical protein